MAHPAGIYQPLERGQIRLLQILTRSDPNPRLPISVTLRTVDLGADPLPEYMALSYEWGSLPEEVRGTPSVKVNGRAFNATTSLSFALVYLRATMGASLFWIDAICINQEDDEERSQQVGLMYQIYSRASCTIVWLGMANRDSDRAMRFIQEATHYSRMSSSGDAEVDEKWLLPLLLHPPDGMYDTWKALFELCRRSYWTRCWIIQEIVASRMALMVCGAEMVHMRSFFALLEGFILHTSKFFDEVRPDYHDLVLLANPVTRVLTATLGDGKSPIVSQDLLRVWERFCNSRATDPRDKVYSLVGLAKPRTDTPLELRYGASIPDVYKEVAAYIIKDSGRLDLLASAGHGLPSNVLPSWVPDWSCDNHFSNTSSNWRPSLRNVMTSKRNWATSGPPEQVVPDATFGENGTTVEVQGMIVCSVKEFAPLIGGKVSSIRKLGCLLEFLLADYKLALQDHDEEHEALNAVAFHLCANLYEMLFYTIMSPEKARGQWLTPGFIQLCFSLIPELARRAAAPTLTPRQEDMLSASFNRPRAVFVCQLPPPFNLAQSIKRSTPNLDPQVAEKLHGIVPFYQTFGLSREYNIDIGDCVAVVKGCSVPIILRRVHTQRRRSNSVRKFFKRRSGVPAEPSEKWEVASEAYLQGIMRGEVVGQIAERAIVLQ